MRTGLILIAAIICVLCNHANGVRQEDSTRVKPAASTMPDSCALAAFLTFESGKLAAVNWLEKRGNQVHLRSVLSQSHVIDAQIELRSDQTASHSAVTVFDAGGETEKPSVRDLGEGAIYWSDMIGPSSLEQAVARARLLEQPSSEIPAASIFSGLRGTVRVERLDTTDWVVSYHNKRYQVLTDDHGCMLSAILPEYGVVIERRSNFPVSQYPLWLLYSAPPDGAYHATAISIRAPQGHVLAGTLTRPLQNKKVPAAVLITGLSPSERNNGYSPWLPFRDIADTLTRSGIAVLRVDDRGVGKSTGDHDPSTTFDEAEDVRSEVAWLRAQPDIDPQRIVLVGYSEGGVIASMVAATDHSIAAVISLAGPGVSGPELARYQIEQIVIHDESILVAAREGAIEKLLSEKLNPRERIFLTINPIELAHGIHCPVLIIQGATDLTVPVRSTEKIAAAIRANGNPDVTVRLFPGVSHSLLPDTAGLLSSRPWLPGFVTSPELLDAIAQWAVAKLVKHQ